MTKTLLVLATASALTLSFALAQNAPSAMDKGGAAAPNIVAAQTPDQWLASRFKGTKVVGQDDAKIGSVDDVLFDKAGSVKAIVIGVGGFLGIGSKEVALTLLSFQVMPGKDGGPEQLKLAMTKDQLSAAAEFKPFEPPRPAGPSAMSGNPTRPSTTGSSPMSPQRQ